MNIIAAYMMIGYKNYYGSFSRSASKRHGRESPYPSILAGTRELARKLAELERRIGGHDEAIRSLVRTIRQLMAPPENTRRSIGFRVEEARPRYRLRRPRRKAPL